MQWADVVRAPSPRHLRQFAGLFLIVFLAIAGWRWFTGRADGWTMAIGIVAIAIGGIGLAAPALVRPIYTGWMVVAFPVGWTVSRVALGAVFFGVVTPIAALFRLGNRDELRLRKRGGSTYWVARSEAAGAREYFRQF
jgi:hypothetical protein